MYSFFFCFLNNLRILKSLTSSSLHAIIVLPFNCDLLKISTIYMLLLLFLDSQLFLDSFIKFTHIYFFFFLTHFIYSHSILSFGAQDALSGFHLLQSETEWCYQLPLQLYGYKYLDNACSIAQTQKHLSTFMLF